MPTIAAPTRRFRTLNSANITDRLEELFEKNNLVGGASRPMDGFAYETYGPEEAYVREVTMKAPRRVATVVSVDSGAWYVCAGFHYVNRLFYLVAKEDVELPAFTDFRY